MEKELSSHLNDNYMEILSDANLAVDIDDFLKNTDIDATQKKSLVRTKSAL